MGIKGRFREKGNSMRLTEKQETGESHQWEELRESSKGSDRKRVEEDRTVMRGLKETAVKGARRRQEG